MRADARRNRDLVLAAADAVFGELGAHASTEEVARRAGVGVATVFRHFPTKRDLVEATLVRHFEHLTERARELLDGEPDAGRALAALVSEMVGHGATKVTLIALLTGEGPFSTGAAAASRELRAAVDTVLRRAQAAGAARADVTIDELYLLVRGLSQAAATQPPTAATLDGAVGVVLTGLGVDRAAASGSDR